MAVKTKLNYAPLHVGGAGVVVALVVWEVTSRSIATATFPAATETLFRLGSLVGNRDFILNVSLTLSHWGLGLLVSVLLAVPAGLLIARVSLVDRSTAGSIDFFRSVPPIVVLPMVLVVAGTGQLGVLVLVVFGAFWPVLLSTVAGVRSVDPLMFDTANAFRLRSSRITRSVTAPAALPQILAGVRVASGIALVVAVVTELVGSVKGLGQYIVIAQLSGNYIGMYAAILAVGIVGLVTNALISLIINRALRPYGPLAGGIA